VFTPCWKLPAAHRLLLEQGFKPRMELAQGYLQVLRQAVSKPSNGGDSDHSTPNRQRKSAALI
jgi:fatty acid desaturase